MRIAIPLDNGSVAHHLGHCPAYLIADAENGTVKDSVEMRNPRHGPGGPPPHFLARLGVSHVIGWGAPEHIVVMLNRLGVQVTLGARGEARQVLQDFLAGSLQLTVEGIRVECHHHHDGDDDHHHHDHPHPTDK